MPADTDRERLIAERAYGLWEEEGRPDGRDKQHWSQAEAELEPEEAADAGPAQLNEHYAPGESAVPGSAGPSTGLPDALAQAGEGVPAATDPADRSRRGRAGAETNP